MAWVQLSDILSEKNCGGMLAELLTSNKKFKVKLTKFGLNNLERSALPKYIKLCLKPRTMACLIQYRGINEPEWCIDESGKLAQWIMIQPKIKCYIKNIFEIDLREWLKSKGQDWLGNFADNAFRKWGGADSSERVVDVEKKDKFLRALGK